MKIAFFTDTYFPNVDGVVFAMESYRKEFEKKGHEVYIFCPGTKEDKKRNTNPRVFYYMASEFKPYPDYKLAIFPFSSITKVRKLKIDIIHCHALATMGLAGYLASKTLKIPCVATYHTQVSEATHYISKGKTFNKLTKSAVWKYCKWYYNLFDAVTTPSEYMGKILKKYNVNSQVFPNGINTKRFQYLESSKTKRKLGLEKYKIAFHVGRLVKEKNIDLIIDSAKSVEKEIPNIKFVFAGDGPARNYYEKRIKEKKVEHLFLFLGMIDQKELPKLYSMADVYIFPSRFDTQGLVAIEAMSCGLPIIGIKNSAVENTIDEGKNGYIFNNNIPSFIFAIKKALKFKTPLQYSMNTAKKYSKEKMAEKMLNLYKSLIKK
ncbi:glycosyltransferase [Candidatus Micrarchaeota archaeon]|nr:glycosyltransferase [Candidatus Micrarchaeota archaeon]